MRVSSLLLVAWALVACKKGDDGPTDTRYHPPGWAQPAEHGTAAKLQELECVACHGETLTGGLVSDQSCDACHTDGWRTDCTYCHGGTDDATGAPPRDIDGSDTASSFPEHGRHVTRGDHAAFGCEQCHATPDDVLSEGHIFVGDDTNGVAEVDLSGGLSAAGSYADGTCSSVYCHGTGVQLGSMTSGGSATCDTCHGPSVRSAIHAPHLAAGATCGDCHGATASGTDTIIGPDEHVDGEIDVMVREGIVWDGATCTGTCHDTEHDGSTVGAFHPAGWDEASVHGPVAKLQQQDCTTCHGADLAGGTSGQSCDECHTADWRTDCTYCHGGADNATGAPPVDIDGDALAISFPEHTVHVEAIDHAAYGCETCHVAPTDVLSDGHVFVGDATPMVAETDLSGGLSPLGVYAAGTCSDVYCHGDGQGAPGTVSSGDSTDCASCHGSAGSAAALSFVHAAHVDAGAVCGECHAATVTGDVVITGAAEHVDGEVDLDFPSGMVFDGIGCTGSCHDIDHADTPWTGGSFHPKGWDDPAMHGPAAKLQVQRCTTCHGDDLLGGTSGSSCDDCHVAGWRFDCTYCHGGADNATGAPPRDIDGELIAISFPEHTVHVEAIDHAAWDCAQCHATPSDVLSPGHLFVDDLTPQAAEVDLSGGLSPTGTYQAGTCSDVYCHGAGPGTVGDVQSGETTDCGSCHGDAAGAQALSGVHGGHVSVGATCGECHAATATGDAVITGPAEHVDGEVDLDFVEAMVFDGTTCTGTCHGIDHAGSGWSGNFHPAGWDDPAMHGPAAKLLQQDCTSCHGAALDGGVSGQGCDDCHAVGWRTDCTYCHGGTDNATGAPPVDIDGSATGLSFPEHTAHVDGTSHLAYDCVECHAKPADVLSSGHLFVDDVTPGVAEVDPSAGIAPDTVHSAGTCSGVYCHGAGDGSPGTVTSGTTTGCDSCHGSAAAGVLSTVHDEHLAQGATCGECHGATVTGDDVVSGPAEHVDGEVDLAFGSGMAWDGASCTGTCHDVGHAGSTWTDGGFHPVGWDDPAQHGPVANLQQSDCTVCHGADLTGGTSGTSCDSCHAAGWRSECTYCHGGTDNATGAPPEDVDGSTTGLSFPEHTVHVEATTHAAWDCEQCHAKPTDIATPGHAFFGDATPGAAEVDLSAGLSPLGSYSGGTCSDVYCHGSGVVPGSVTSGTSTSCGSCHGHLAVLGLSTVHPDHIYNGVTCEECHAATATGYDTISGPAEHVDGNIDVVMSANGVTWDGTGCTGTCHDIVHDGSTWLGDFHPATFAQATEHGLPAKFQEQPCTQCHGNPLTGGPTAPSCDSCHTAGWRTDCVYCHGGADNATGAPPVDIDGSAVNLTFEPHGVHVEGTSLHAAFDCVECHDKPVDVLTPGHFVWGDATPGLAEVDFGNGLSTAGTYSSSPGTCSDVYCHGDGVVPGTVTVNDTLACDSCHGGINTPGALSGKHAKHIVLVGASCEECHSATVSDPVTILDPSVHVNGAREVTPVVVTYNGVGCTGTCHGQAHNPTDDWFGVDTGDTGP